MPLKNHDAESVSEHLAEETGNSEDQYEYSGDIPEPEDLEVEDAAEFYSDEK